jgi:hypothetical protein
MKRFCCKWIAVNPVNTFVFGMTKHQTIDDPCVLLILAIPISQGKHLPAE